jgi:hypothetical protein
LPDRRNWQLRDRDQIVVAHGSHGQQRTRRIDSFFGLSVMMELLEVDPIIGATTRSSPRGTNPIGA